MSGRAGWLMFAALALALAMARAQADQSPAPAPAKAPAKESPASPVPEEELLEFLGSLDAEGEEWAEYLTETDIEKVAESETAPAAPEGKKDE